MDYTFSLAGWGDTIHKDTLKLAFLKVGDAANPIQANIPSSLPKFLAATTDTLVIKPITFLMGNPSHLIATVSTTGDYLSDITIDTSLSHGMTINPKDSSITISFKTIDELKNPYITLALKDSTDTYTNSFTFQVEIIKNPSVPLLKLITSTIRDLNIYPNPVGNIATVDLPDDRGYQLNVVDALGKVLISKLVEQGISQLTLNTSSLPSGGYFLVIMNNKSLISKAFSK